MVLLVWTGSFMYRLSIAGQIDSSVGLSCGWLTIGLSGLAWLGQLGFPSCGLLSSSKPAWLIYIESGQSFKRRSRITSSLSRPRLWIGTLALLSCSICKSKSQRQLSIKGGEIDNPLIGRNYEITLWREAINWGHQCNLSQLLFSLLTPNSHSQFNQDAGVS